MQLAEQGRLDLHSDINRYLDLRLRTFGGSRAVTLADLLTHTSGVDDHMIGAESPIRKPIDLGVYFQNHVPVLIREPGAEIDYSNHGVALAAHVVECVSRRTFYDYAEQHILSPLEMRHSTFRQPLPEPLRRNIAYERFEKPYTVLYPVATLVTTPTDMAKFMLAHLKIRPFSTRILTDDTLDRMHAEHFGPSPNVPGIAYGFSRRGMRQAAHCFTPAHVIISHSCIFCPRTASGSMS